MNKSTVERQTRGILIKESPGSWSLVIGDVSFAASAMKDSIAIKMVHDQFWEYRKKQVLQRDGFKCVRCKSPFRVQVDHIVNRSQGGTHDMDNLQVLCSRCHESKTNLRPNWVNQ